MEIKDVLKIGNGRDYKQLENGDCPVYGTGGYMTSVNKYLYDGESVCIGRKGTINKPFFLSGKFWTVDTLFYTHSFRNILPKFCYFIFKQINWLKYNEASGVPSLSKSTIEKIPITIPTKNEQKKIADFLSLIDDRIATQNKIIEKYESLIKGITDSIFRKKEKNVKLNDCLTCHSSTLTESEVIERKGIYPVYGAAGIFSHFPDYNISEDSILIIKDGSNVGKLQYASNKYSVISTLNYLTAKTDICLKYIYYHMQNITFEKYKVGSGIPHIYFKNYGNELIYCPGFVEQEKIAYALSMIDHKIIIEKSLLEKYIKQKKYFLQNLFI